MLVTDRLALSFGLVVECAVGQEIMLQLAVCVVTRDEVETDRGLPKTGRNGPGRNLRLVLG